MSFYCFIDIEGFEPFAFMQAKNLFDNLLIPVILMEWGLFTNLRVCKPEETNNLIKFLHSYKLKPFNLQGQILDEKYWVDSWPWDVVWKLDGF